MARALGRYGEAIRPDEKDAELIAEALTLGCWPTGHLFAQRFSEERLKELLTHRFKVVRDAAGYALYLKKEGMENDEGP